ncbi:Glutamate-gated chloride channel [Nymphon striatum]|nr:Glutamate-gated chloride channel [Nymphon striatum]
MLFCYGLWGVHSAKYDRFIQTRKITGESQKRGADGPAVVYVNMFLRSITQIDDVKMEYTVQLTFREEWVDDRLRYNNRLGRIDFLTLTDITKVWMPDLFFSNEKTGHYHKIILPNVMIRIHPTGKVLISIRITLVLACPMDLKFYPLDKQICSIRMPSYGYTTEDMVLLWKQEDPVQIKQPLHLPRFTLERYYTTYCQSKTKTVSWVSFWLDQNAIPARVSLGVTTLLTMATQTSSINSSLPPVSYTKAIDIWTGVCLTFVFAALLEFALVNYASRSDVHKQRNKKMWELEHPSIDAADHIEDGPTTFAMKPLVRHGGPSVEKIRECEVHMQPRRNFLKTWAKKFSSRSKRIDVMARIAFPIVFALFNLVYWSTYLLRMDEGDLKTK